MSGRYCVGSLSGYSGQTLIEGPGGWCVHSGNRAVIKYGGQELRDVSEELILVKGI